jgi:outer membrane protein TolC
VLQAGDSVSVTAREELQSLSVVRSIHEDVLRMNRSFRVPRLNSFVDLAAQGFDFRVNNKSFFYLAGLQLQIPLFTGRRNVYKIQQTEWDIRNLATHTRNTEKQLEMAALVSRNNAVTAWSNYQSATKQQEAARQYFKLVDRGYQEGVNSFIEWLDARNQLTNAQLQVTIQQYEFLSALADFERQTATYSFNQ